MAGVAFIKDLAESASPASLPPSYAFNDQDPTAVIDDMVVDSLALDDAHDTIPVIDFSLLVSDDPDQRSKTIQDLHKACQEWGFFMVVNHGVPEALTESMINKCREFFDLTVEEKQEFQGKHALDPIRCGTSFNFSAEEVHFWRDFLKIMVHPQFRCPHKPPGLSAVVSDYCNQERAMVRELLRAISLGLGLEEDRIEKAYNLEMGLEMFVANYYPACPQPELAMGMPPHSDHGLLTVLTHNQVAGLQIWRRGKWVQVHSLPNSFILNVGDHLEIFSNGKYKSILHRAVVNNRVARMSVGIGFAPSLDTVAAPAEELAHPAAAYKPIKFQDYLESQQKNKLQGKSCLDAVRI
ncbi:hypothetical protein Droror1_Dr00006044 [Drosera rotundifolia]